MIRKVFYSSCLLLSPIVLFAQEESDKNIQLREVVVTEKTKTVSKEVAAKSKTIATEDLQSNLTRSMSELLSEVSALQVKSMGQGAMSTVSIRGASSNHTQVQWNGITLNSPLTGSFDFSQIPVYFVDDVNIFYGGGEQLGASGAIGGSINFSNGFKHVNRPLISVVSEMASNSTYSEAIHFMASRKRFTSSTRAFYQQSEGDFRFINKVFSKDWIYERRKNADYKQGGMMQEFFYTTSRGDQWSAIAWWHTDNRSLPQSLLVNDNTKSEKIRSNNFRSMLSYQGHRGQHHFKGTAAYLNSTSRYRQIFWDTTRTVNQSNSLVMRGDYHFTGWKRVALAAALSYRFDEVNSDSYAAKRASRNTLTAQMLTTFRATRRLHLDLKTSAEMVDAKLYAYYNAGARYRFIERYLTLKASNSYNFRAPSMNDLYWQPGGNPDLQPETGFSSEITLESHPQFGPVELHLDAS
ncbi:MAG: TonB-dependent receptor plug domain-containing protein, partial [Bacteroidales bacterium]